MAKDILGEPYIQSHKKADKVVLGQIHSGEGQEEGRDWSNVATNQLTQKSASSPQKLGEPHGTDYPL